MTIPSIHLELAHDMAMQAQLNEYVWPITKDEENIIEGLEKLLLQVVEETQWQLEDIAPAILIVAQYKDLSKTLIAPMLMSKGIKDALKNSYLTDIIDYAINNRNKEIEIAKNIPFWSYNKSILD